MAVLYSCTQSPPAEVEIPAAIDSVEEERPKHWTELHPDAVTEIDLSGQELTELPDLSMYPNLKRLDLSHNQISLEDLEQCKKLMPGRSEQNPYGSSQLEYLDLSHNAIDFLTYLPITRCHPKLNYLGLSHNQVKQFYGFQEFPQDSACLTVLDLSDNLLEELNLSYYLDSLNLSNNPALRGEQMLLLDRVRHVDLQGCDSAAVIFKERVTRTISCNTGA